MSETNSASIIPMDDLIAKYADWKTGHSKSLAIVQSSSAIVSIIASSLLISTMFRSPTRLSTTYHRILLGMSISDILYSLSLSTFQATTPSDASYMVWNARGNQAICTAQGFLSIWGVAATLTYSCSLNLYYLASVKNKTETYIRTKIEPFFHGIPILIAFVSSINGLVNQNYNDYWAGTCTESPIYTPEHCIGYDEGEIREGFEIPCGRGRNYHLYNWIGGLVWIAPPIIMYVSLAMIYRNAKESSNPHAEDGDNSNSRAVVHKALAYSISYCLAWILPIIAGTLVAAGVNSVALYYIASFLNPVQGLFNFLIYLYL